MKLEMTELKALRDLLDYCRAEEQQHYEQLVESEGSIKYHIYKSILTLDRAVDAHDKNAKR